MNENKERLITAARRARAAAYAPYSGFRVGAALLTEDGRIFTGCNVENAAYSPTLCAERVALGAAVAAGARRFAAVAVIGGHGDTEADCAPCGVCRESLSEFATDDFRFLFQKDGRLIEMTISELLPARFKLK